MKLPALLSGWPGPDHATFHHDTFPPSSVFCCSAQPGGNDVPAGRYGCQLDRPLEVNAGAAVAVHTQSRMTQHFGIVEVECTLRSPTVQSLPILALVFGLEIGPWDAQRGNPRVSLNRHVAPTHQQLPKTIDTVVNMIQTGHIRLLDGVIVAIDVVPDVFQAMQLVVDI